MNNVFISCKESRIEKNRSFYGCFNLGAFDAAQSLTVANALRRTLLSECPGLGIISVTIENVSHEYSTLPGMRESVLDLLLNLKEIVFCSSKQNSPFQKDIVLKNQAPQESTFFQNHRLRSTPKKPVVGYLKVKGPGVIRAKDLKLPPLIQCVDPDQYIATLAEDGFLCMKFIIMEGKGYLIQKNNSFIDNTLIKKRANLLSELKNIKSDMPFHSPSLKDGEISAKEGEPEGNFQFQEPKIQTHNFAKRELEKEIDSLLPRPFYPKSEWKEEKGIPKQDLIAKKAQKSKPLNLDCIFNPVTKVSYLIEDFDNQVTNDFNNHLNFVNNISSLIESRNYVARTRPSKEKRGGGASHHLTSPPPWGSEATEGKKKGECFAEREKNFPFLLVGATKETEHQQKEIILNGKSLSNLVETYTKYEMQELSSYLHPLKKQNSLHNIVLEIWTNGSLHPREALAIGFQNLGSLFFNYKKTNVF